MEATDIDVAFKGKRTGYLLRHRYQAVDRISLTVHKGETLGVVGESANRPWHLPRSG